MSEGRSRPENHLAGETSPYLLQHRHNPVDWYPWGDPALERARRENKPIFLSIGYAACHWCHVMERESFEDPAVAAVLNEHFVAIKVDREERPDLDAIYMNAVQLLTGAGGWPLNVFLTPDLRPFFGGTYFPPDSRYGRPVFLDVLRQLHDAYRGRPGDVERAAASLTEQIRSIAEAGPAGDGTRVGRSEAAAAAAELAGRFDGRHGGFGPAPKFPPDGALALLLREHERSKEAAPLSMAVRTLESMAEGGMYDHVGGGFARYSVDDRWLVPHFEKMLYNQALLVPVYVDAFLVTGRPFFRRVVEETLDFVRREMTDPAGGLWSSLDADSEGEEGRFYVWTPAEIRDVLGEADGAGFCEIYDIRPDGNFEGRNIPNLIGATPERLAAALALAPQRAALLAARERRVRPGTDDKVLTAWNGLAIGAFARAFQAFGRPQDLASARAAADFAATELLRDGRLLASWRQGRARLNGYLDDYAFLARGLVDLYESCFVRRYLDDAAALCATLVERFTDRARGGFWFTSDDHETLLTRSLSVHDGALPAGSGVAAEALLRVALHLDDARFRNAALAALAAYRPLCAPAPGAFTALLAAADLVDGPTHEIALAGDPSEPDTASLLAVVRGRYLPRRAVALARPGEPLPATGLLAGKAASDGPTAWVCHDRVCDRPTRDAAELARQLG